MTLGLLLLCGFSCGCQQAWSQNSDLLGWELVWNDEFAGPDVDASNWEVLTRRDSHNNEAQYYLPEQISIHEGNLRITATDEPLDGKLYRSGRMWTWGEWAYGRFEARLDLPTTQGMWPAFWLTPRSVGWPTGGEIDIMENKGREPYQTSSAYHWGSSVSVHQWVSDPYTATEDGNPVNFHAGFHTYAAEWEPGLIRYYVDDNLHVTVTDTTAPIHATPKSIILNLAVGGNFGGDPDATTVFPQYLDIDYVRVWQRPGPLAVTTVNPSFETVYDAWPRFGNSNNNVTATGIVSSDGRASLKAFGQYSGAFNWSGASQSVPITGGTKLQARVDTLVRSSDSIVGTDNYSNLKLEYYSVFGATHDSADFLGETVFSLADGNSLEDVWIQHVLSDRSPLDAVEARITLIFLQPGMEGGAVYFDNVQLDALPSADFDLDGTVDGEDLANWAADYGGPGSDADFDRDSDGGDFLDWQRQLGDSFSDITSAGAAIPEPAAGSMWVMLLFSQLSRRFHAES